MSFTITITDHASMHDTITTNKWTNSFTEMSPWLQRPFVTKIFQLLYLIAQPLSMLYNWNTMCHVIAFTCGFQPDNYQRLTWITVSSSDADCMYSHIPCCSHPWYSVCFMPELNPSLQLQKPEEGREMKHEKTGKAKNIKNSWHSKMCSADPWRGSQGV